MESTQFPLSVELALVVHPTSEELLDIARLCAVEQEYDQMGNYLTTWYAVTWINQGPQHNCWLPLASFEPNTPSDVEKKYELDTAGFVTQRNPALARGLHPLGRKWCSVV